MLIVESLNGDQLYFESVDHHFNGCTRLYCVCNDFFNQSVMDWSFAFAFGLMSLGLGLGTSES